MPGFPSLKEFVEAMSVAWPVAFAICLASCGTLLAAYLGVPYATHFPDWLLTMAFLLAIFSGAVCMTTALRGLISAGKKLLYWRWKKKDQAQRLSRLNDLPVHEHRIMAFLCTTNTQVFPMQYSDARLVGLIEKGLINRQPGQHHLLNWPHAVPNFIWDEMRRTPDRFFLDVRVFGNPLSRDRL